jgi:hypothetical protein
MDHHQQIYIYKDTLKIVGIQISLIIILICHTFVSVAMIETGAQLLYHYISHNISYL